VAASLLSFNRYKHQLKAKTTICFADQLRGFNRYKHQLKAVELVELHCGHPQFQSLQASIKGWSLPW